MIYRIKTYALGGRLKRSKGCQEYITAHIVANVIIELRGRLSRPLTTPEFRSIRERKI